MWTWAPGHRLHHLACDQASSASTLPCEWRDGEQLLEKGAAQPSHRAPQQTLPLGCPVSSGPALHERDRNCQPGQGDLPRETLGPDPCQELREPRKEGRAHLVSPGASLQRRGLRSVGAMAALGRPQAGRPPGRFGAPSWAEARVWPRLLSPEGPAWCFCGPQGPESLANRSGDSWQEARSKPFFGETGEALVETNKWLCPLPPRAPRPHIHPRQAEPESPERTGEGHLVFQSV